MSPHELSAYITNLLRSEAEVIASFLIGVLLTGTLAFSLRRWLTPGRVSEGELARKDAEIARKDAEIAKRDTQIAKVEGKLASLEGKLLERVGLLGIPQENTIHETPPVGAPLVPADYVAAKARCVQLESENARLVQVAQSLEQTVEHLRKELTQVSEELTHLAKWLKVTEAENVRLAESGSLTKG
ncbi:MAG: hypothetical protein K2R98_03785 [Gemmataceae bacterium]|nr:hypothetical protein [Gemmataceae bacterium]